MDSQKQAREEAVNNIRGFVKCRNVTFIIPAQNLKFTAVKMLHMLYCMIAAGRQLIYP